MAVARRCAVALSVAFVSGPLAGPAHAQDKPDVAGAERNLDVVSSEGQDIGQPSSNDPLLRIGEKMRRAHQHITDQDTSRLTQDLQQKIIDDLTDLIRQTAERCKGAGQHESQFKPSTASANPRPSSRSARGSVTRLDQQAAEPTSPETARQLNRQAWGHLPATVRQSMLSADFDRFLPKYERLIERYFARLAEEAGKP